MLSTSFAVLALWTLTLVSAVDEYSPIYFFNQGRIEESKSCTADEWNRVKTSMGVAVGRRQLRLSSTQRSLGKCDSCGGKPLCLAFSGLGCARITGRRMLESDNERSLQNSPCSTDITAIDTALTALRPQVSTKCQALISAKRNITCALYTKDCDITGFTLLRFGAGTVIKKINPTGSSFCMSEGLVNFRADTNFFLGKVKLELFGPDSDDHFYFEESSRPYTLYGRQDHPSYFTNPSHFEGAILWMGKYTIKAYSLDDPASGRNATFTVNNC